MIDLLCVYMIHLCACFVFKIGVGVGEVGGTVALLAQWIAVRDAEGTNTRKKNVNKDNQIYVTKQNFKLVKEWSMQNFKTKRQTRIGKC